MIFTRYVMSVPLILLALFACKPSSSSSSAEVKPEPIGYQAQPEEPVFDEAISWKAEGVQVFKNAHLLTATGKEIENGFLVIEDAKIKQVGEGEAPEIDGAEYIDVGGKYLTPGLIDTHSHIGVYALPGAMAHADGNEATKPVTAEVWAEHSFWPQDPAIWRAVAGGVTTIQVLPGSANIIGGRGVSLSLIPELDVGKMKFPGAPQGVKMACGENPKRVYSQKGGPGTRMGNISRFRDAFQKAYDHKLDLEKYQRDLDHWKKRSDEANGDKDALKKLGDAPKPPKRDHAMDTLVAVMQGKALVNIHCYRADEMAIMLELAETYGFKIRSFHHAVEAYKLRDKLAAQDVSASVWTDWWGFKMESFDGINFNPALLHQAGVRVALHSDSPEDIRFLNIEVAKARSSGALLDIEISDDELLQWITLNPAWALGIDDVVGSLEEGKWADIVVWDDYPFSAYAKAESVWIRGKRVFHRPTQEFFLGDFERGIRNYGLADRGSQEKALPGEGIPKLERAKSFKRLDLVYDEDFAIENVWVEMGNGKSLTSANVLVRSGKIAGVGANLKIPEGIKRIDGSSRMLTPGLIESQSQVGLVMVEAEMVAQDIYSGEGFNPGFKAIDGFDPFSVRIPIEREYGITSAILEPKGGAVAGVGQAVNFIESWEAMEASSKELMFANMRSWSANRGSFWMQMQEAVDDTILFMESLKSARAQPLAHQLSLKPIHLEAMANFLKGRTRLILSGERLSDIHAAVNFKKQLREKGYKVDLAISGASESWLAAKMLAEENIPVIIAPTKQLPYSLDQLRVRDDLATVLSEAGVEVIISASDMNIRRLRQQAGRAVNYGMPYEKAIAAITSAPAKLAGLTDRGVIEVGKRADLVLWQGDALEASSYVAGLWIHGKQQDLGNRQTELSKKYSKN